MKKLAVLIGINYKDTDAELNGCINDVNDMQSFLIDKCNYHPSDIVIMTEEVDKKPTANNIVTEFYNLLKRSVVEEVDEILFHYSGHGTYLSDRDGDEKDDFDEAIVPLDYERNGVITDDILNKLLETVSPKCKCVFIFDCCHSGTILDLKYMYQGRNNNIKQYERKSKITGNVLTISGCKDEQTSADALRNGRWAGAMTNAFLKVMNKFNNDITCMTLLKEMRKVLNRGGYEQIPQICCNNKLSNTTVFSTNGENEPFLRCN